MGLFSRKKKLAPQEPKGIDEMDDDTAINVLVKELGLLPSTMKNTIDNSGRSISEVIDHLQKRTPEGVEYLRRYRNFAAIMRGAMKEVFKS